MDSCRLIMVRALDCSIRILKLYFPQRGRVIEGVIQSGSCEVSDLYPATHGPALVIHRLVCLSGGLTDTGSILKTTFCYGVICKVLVIK